MSRDPQHRNLLGVLLTLGRVANLPTIWSNCLAAWLLGGGGTWARFALLSTGATLLYTGGMFLNDAFDEKFDRRFRPERPIPVGQIDRRSVWLIGSSSLALGSLAWLMLGIVSGGFGALLVSCIVLYDATHKRSSLGPLLMSGCRCLLYLAAGAAAHAGWSPALIVRALALAAYISGISYLARGESRPGRAPVWTVGLLFVPNVVGLWQVSGTTLGTFLAQVLLAGWISWCLCACRLSQRPLSASVAGLLAGISLVDGLAAAAIGANPLLFPALFVLARLLQKLAPAT
jgi:hypothetical protein